MEHPENNPEYAGLTVNSGVAPVSIINPYLKRGRFNRHRLTAADYVEGILKGNVTILGQAVTACESASAACQEPARAPVSTNSAYIC